jgi:cytochrome P450
VSALERPEVDFDQFSDEFGANRHAEWAKMRQCPVAHNARYGGFWVVSGYDEVVAVSRDGATFSSKYEEDSACRACPQPKSPRSRDRPMWHSGVS